MPYSGDAMNRDPLILWAITCFLAGVAVGWKFAAQITDLLERLK